MADRRNCRIAVIAGDGIGVEVMPEGLRVLERAAELHGFRLGSPRPTLPLEAGPELVSL